MRRTLSLVGMWWLALPSSAQDFGTAAGLHHDVVLTEYSSLSRSAEVARRTLSPLVNLELTRASVASPLRLQAIDLSRERYLVYVPVNRPPQGYGLLAFIPPWQDARLPSGWAAALDHHGMILVTAAASGNQENVIDRRIPLALLGAYNVTQRYPIDGDRIYIGGFSGGARVAMKVGLAYPDLFRGTLLNAGSDPIGEQDAVLPPDDLFHRYQSSSRIVYVTGTEDEWNMHHDMISRDSMNAWCVYGTAVETMIKMGHEIADTHSLDLALSALDRRDSVDSGKLSACRARREAELAAELKREGKFLDEGKSHDAWRLLTTINLRYAGLASPEIAEFARRIGSQR